MFILVRAVRAAAAVAIVLILAGIAVHVFGANMHNGLVSTVNDAAKWLTQPFHNVFSPHNHKARIGVNWGLAAVVYAVAAGVISALLARSALGFGTFGRRRITA